MSTINTSMSAANLLAMRQNILQQNSVLQKAAAGPASGAGGIGGIGDAAGTSGTSSAKGAGFGDALKGALNKVNNLQADATAASEAYERGETTDIAAVMLSRQQASIGFQATLQVRNKLLAAYKDIMSMPV